MFAGEEITIPFVMDRGMALELSARAMLEVWKDGIIQDGQTAEVYHDFSAVPFGRMQEMMIYRDEASVESWERLGADEENRNTMVHFLFPAEHLGGDENMVFVLDDVMAAEAISIISAVRSVFELNREQERMFILPGAVNRGRAA
jgi:hypothetical protein